MAVVTTDLLIFLLIGAKIANAPIKIIFLVILFRALLFGFGGTMWFIGYCVLFIFLGVYLFRTLMYLFIIYSIFI